jgi:hypothetical protein
MHHLWSEFILPVGDEPTPQNLAEVTGVAAAEVPFPCGTTLPYAHVKGPLEVAHELSRSC